MESETARSACGFRQTARQEEGRRRGRHARHRPHSGARCRFGRIRWEVPDVSVVRLSPAWTAAASSSTTARTSSAWIWPRAPRFGGLPAASATCSSSIHPPRSSPARACACPTAKAWRLWRRTPANCSGPTRRPRDRGAMCPPDLFLTGGLVWSGRRHSRARSADGRRGQDPGGAKLINPGTTTAVTAAKPRTAT